MSGDRFVTSYDSRVHLPPSSNLVADIEQVGQVYRIPLRENGGFDKTRVAVPSEIAESTRDRKGRRWLAVALNLNSRESHFGWLGKANSAFVARLEGIGMVLDVLIESADHVRDSRIKLHDYLREVTEDYNTALALANGERWKALSGHIAPVVISDVWVSQVMSLDAFSGRRAAEGIKPQVRPIIELLWANRIMPFTADGYPILLPKADQSSVMVW